MKERLAEADTGERKDVLLKRAGDEDSSVTTPHRCWPASHCVAELYGPDSTESNAPKTSWCCAAVSCLSAWRGKQQPSSLESAVEARSTRKYLRGVHAVQSGSVGRANGISSAGTTEQRQPGQEERQENPQLSLSLSVT